MKDRFERIVSLLLTVAAVGIAVGLVHREFFSAPPAVVARPALPAWEEDWKSMISAGERSGDPGAPVTIIEFSDLECPFCAIFHKSLRELIAENPKRIVAYFVHLPAPSHRFAMPAARVAECARARGHFHPLVDEVFARQDSIGLRSWNSFARAAAIADTTGFDACARDTSDVPRIVAGLSMGQRFRVNATPTIIINGWRVEGALSKSELSKMIDAITSAKAPYSDAQKAIL
ncbi:MAG: thioredoxin domain-containing protein [Gemmatimonadota bacterium]